MAEKKYAGGRTDFGIVHADNQVDDAVIVIEDGSFRPTGERLTIPFDSTIAAAELFIVQAAPSHAV